MNEAGAHTIKSHEDRTYAVTGAASGIGAATAHYLRERGARVIACDLHDADVVADLATEDGRAALVEGVTRLSQRRFWRTVTRIALPVLPIAVVLARHVPALKGELIGGWNAQAAIYAFWEPFVALGIILALLHGFTTRFARLGPLGTALARRAYAVYVIHPPILVAIALSWRNVPAPPLVKFAVTGAATCAACFWIAGLLLRTAWVRRIL
jgi:NAD(P)-dependent dehydrogenase (short-subunit alcohol dehydrogenase family)